uniref:Arrestin-like N-terminal domain-containing protein n=1 Tax=Meloidogyne javanica TaxID=6303 RepID=A0A915MGU1_MELJA
CPCEALAERILAGESPAQVHRWALHNQPPKFLRQLIRCLAPPSVVQSEALIGQFSHSANQLWATAGMAVPAGDNDDGQFGKFSFDSLERSKPATNAVQCCEHKPLFLAILLLLEILESEDLQLKSIDKEGMTPLHLAAAAGSEQCCELLLAPNWRLPVDSRDNLGRTPLHLAAWCRVGTNVVKLLMAKKSIAATARDQQGWTPLHIAVMANNRPVLEKLLEAMGPAGAQYAVLYDRTEIAKLLTIQAGATNDTRDRFNVTPAHYAAACGSISTLKAVLCDREGQQQPVDSEGRTPFMWAVIGQNEKLVLQMLSNKTRASQLLACKDHFKRNCLHLAALRGGVEMCKLLVASNNTLNVETDENGATPEHLAAGQGNSELVLWFGYQRGHLSPPLDGMDREKTRIVRLSLRTVGSVYTGWQYANAEYESKENILDIYNDLTGNLSNYCDETMELNCGEYNFEFSVKIPMNAISSYYEEGYGNVKYSIVATLDIVEDCGESEIVSESEFLVRSFLSLDSPHFLNPAYSTEEIVTDRVCLCFGNSKEKRKITIKSPSLGLLPGN